MIEVQGSAPVKFPFVYLLQARTCPDPMPILKCLLHTTKGNLVSAPLPTDPGGVASGTPIGGSSCLVREFISVRESHILQDRSHEEGYSAGLVGSRHCSFPFMTSEIRIYMHKNIFELVRYMTNLLKEHVCQVYPSESMPLATPHGTPGCSKYPDKINLAVITKERWRNRLEALVALFMVWKMLKVQDSQGCPVPSAVSSAVCSFTKFSQINMVL